MRTVQLDERAVQASTLPELLSALERAGVARHGNLTDWLTAAGYAVVTYERWARGRAEPMSAGALWSLAEAAGCWLALDCPDRGKAYRMFNCAEAVGVARELSRVQYIYLKDFADAMYTERTLVSRWFRRVCDPRSTSLLRMFRMVGGTVMVIPSPYAGDD